jgi:hypothetical protein
MPKRYRVTASGVELGWFLFEEADTSMAMVVGTFEPSAGYADRAELFVSLSHALETKSPSRDDLLARRDKLQLGLATETGAEIKTDWIMISDYADDNERAFEAKICSAEDLHSYFDDN